MPKTIATTRLPFSRPLLLLCAGILVATLASAVICQRIIVNSLNLRGDQYGQAMANLGARQAIDATLNHDLVSLQVILSDIAENSDVVNATIHDVENNLLVQAGNRPKPAGRGGQWKNYTAPITLHNSIAGHVTVTLDATGSLSVQQQLYWLFGFMAALLLALTLSALYFGRSWNTPISLSRIALPIVDTPPERSPAGADNTAPAMPRRGLPRIELMVQFHNLRELQGQLNSQSFRSLGQRLEEHLRGVLTLYGGQLIELNGTQAQIGFPGEGGENHGDSFNALCTAVLLRKLNQQAKGVQLRLSLLLRQRPSDSALLKNLPYELQDSDALAELLRDAPDNEILLEVQLLKEGDMAQRVVCEPLSPGGDILRVVEIPEPYQSLLAKQLGQLQRR